MMKKILAIVMILVTNSFLLSSEYEKNVWIERNGIKRFEGERTITYKQRVDEDEDTQRHTSVIFSRETKSYNGTCMYYSKMCDTFSFMGTPELKDPDNVFKALEKKFNK